jgi:hypothetical protein
VLDLNAEKAGEAVAASIGGLFARCDVADEASAKAAIDAAPPRARGRAHPRQLRRDRHGGPVVGREGPMPLEPSSASSASTSSAPST